VANAFESIDTAIDTTVVPHPRDQYSCSGTAIRLSWVSISALFSDWSRPARRTWQIIAVDLESVKTDAELL
jgi:hypothetical protein